MKELKLMLMGFGSVGKAFAKLLEEKDAEIRNDLGVQVKIVGITTGSRGNLYNKDGLDGMACVRELNEKGRFTDEKNICTLSGMEMLETLEYDCLMELSPLNIFTGQPATDHIMTAIGRGKDAITANKGPVAWHFNEIRDFAKEKGVRFCYETVVMDGTPVFNFTEKTLRMAKVTEVTGILNSTTNFILEELEKGAEMDDIMKRGTDMGFIEADPRMDIEGFDAAAKITALLNVLMDANITPDMVDRKGIEDITLEDIKDAQKRGMSIKLLCEGRFDENGKVIASVKPMEVPRTDMLAAVNSTTSIVSITTDLMKKISIVEHEPEIEQTAYGVFSDMLRVIEGN